MKISRIRPSSQAQSASDVRTALREAKAFQRVMAAVESAANSQNQTRQNNTSPDISLLRVQFDDQSVGFVGPSAAPATVDIDPLDTNALTLIPPEPADFERAALVSDAAFAATLAGYPISAALLSHFNAGSGQAFPLNLKQIEKAATVQTPDGPMALQNFPSDMATQAVSVFEAYFNENPTSQTASLLMSDSRPLRIDPAVDRDAYLALSNPRIAQSVDATRGGDDALDLLVRLRGADRYDVQTVDPDADTPLPLRRLQQTGLARPFVIELSQDVPFKAGPRLPS